MKFITVKDGDKIHIYRGIVKDTSKYGIGDPAALCGVWAAPHRSGDKIHDTIPSGTICKTCKKLYLKNHTEDDLFTELI